jgi:hypothetical protein
VANTADTDSPAALSVNGPAQQDGAIEGGYMQQLFEIAELFKSGNMLLALPVFLVGSFRAICK